MRFENGPSKYEVDFHHSKEKVMVPPKAAPEKQKEVEAHVTAVAIKVTTNGQESITSAKTICRPPDQFSKPLGRKLALTRALKISGLSKDEKELIWDKYLASLATKCKVIVGNTPATQDLRFVQMPKKLFLSALMAWQSYEAHKKKTGHGALIGEVPACPLPMEHPYFANPALYGFEDQAEANARLAAVSVEGDIPF